MAGQVNIEAGESFETPKSNHYAYAFLQDGTPVRINGDGTHTAIAVGDLAEGNIIADAGVGLLDDLPDIGTIDYGAIYVTTDTFKKYTKVDDTTWQTKDLIKAQYITDTSEVEWSLYQYDGIEVNLISTGGEVVGGFQSPNLYPVNAQSAIDTNYKGLDYDNDANEVVLQGTTSSSAGDVLVERFLFDSPYDEASIKEGAWTWHYHAECGTNAGDTHLVFEFGMYNPVDQSETPLLTTESQELTNEYIEYITVFTGDEYTVEPAYHGYIKVYARTTRSQDTDVSFKIGGGDAFFLAAPFSERHNLSRGRSVVDCHPTSAITNLDQLLSDRITDAPSGGGQVYGRSDGSWVLVEGAGGVVVKSKDITPMPLSNMSGDSSPIKPLSRYAATTTNPSPLPTTSPYTNWSDGGLCPYLTKAGKLTYFAFRCTGASVSTADVGSTPLARFDVYKNYHSSRILLSTIRIPISSGTIGIYGNASTKSDIFGSLAIDIDVNLCDSIGVEFVAETTDNNSINNLLRIEGGMCHEALEDQGDLQPFLADLVGVPELSQRLKSTYTGTSNNVDFGETGYAAYVFTGSGAVTITDSNRVPNTGGTMRLTNADSYAFPAWWYMQSGSQDFDKAVSNFMYHCMDDGKVIYTITNDEV